MGSRSALRIVLHLLRHKETVLSQLISSLNEIKDNIVECDICNNIDTCNPCSICCDHARDSSTMCVVSDIADLWAIENAGFYNGKYHVLGNKLSAVSGITPDDIDINGLHKRTNTPEIKEVIIALSADLDGQTTMFYIKDRLSDSDVKITTLSHGVPIGSDLEYLDNGTIITAFNQRHII